MLGSSVSKFAIVAALAFIASGASAGTFKVDCDKGGPTIQDRLDRNTKSGDVVEVSGACTEFVIIRQSGIRLIAQPGASISPPSGMEGDEDTITVVGQNATIRGFTINGGQTAITVARGSATIEDNVIRGAKRFGAISVTRRGYALIRRNDIQNNDRNGIVVRQGSAADVHDNTAISNNVRSGIIVEINGSADIDGNTIEDNGRDGIGIFGGASVQLSGDDFAVTDTNVINGNARSGVRCRNNSHINVEGVQDFTGDNGTPPSSGENANVSSKCSIFNSQTNPTPPPANIPVDPAFPQFL